MQTNLLVVAILIIYLDYCTTGGQQSLNKNYFCVPILGLCSQGPDRVDGEECNGNQEDRDKLIECGKAQCWSKEGNTQSNEMCESGKADNGGDIQSHQKCGMRLKQICSPSSVLVY